jgi:hypothetical protein
VALIAFANIFGYLVFASLMAWPIALGLVIAIDAAVRAGSFASLRARR